MRPSLLALSSCLLALLATPALASHTIVPDQHATIQLGVDSGVDTVLVRPGEYPEVVTTDRGIVVLGLASTDPSTVERAVLPAVGGFVGTAGNWEPIGLSRLRFMTRVVVNQFGGDDSQVTDCRLDGGLYVGGSGNSLITNCIVFGDLEQMGFRGEVAMNTVVEGTIRTASSNSAHLVHNNVVVGPAAVGIENTEDTWVRNNYIRGCVIGISGACRTPSGIQNNIIEDCSGSGISFDHCTQSFVVEDVIENLVRRCGGRGISVPDGYNTIAGNVVEDSGAEGIFQSGIGSSVRDNIVLRSGATGIRAGRVIGDNTGNIVLRSSGDGIHFQDVNRLTGNIAGRNGGRGIAVDGTKGHTRSIRSNTVYSNDGAGFSIGSGESLPDSLTNNISYGNAVGLAWSGPSTPFLGCNDWFANTGAAVTGTSVGATDVAVDPQFCDLPNDIVSLAAGSPLADLAGCGQVGALGVACAVAVGVGDPRPASLGRLRIQPQPSQGAMSFAFDPSDAATTLEVYDVSGARRMTRTLAPRTVGYAWNGTDDAGQPLPAGVYFAKLVQSAARSEATVVVIR